ncbi:substrate-binding periplasmic protein [Oceanospirillum sediminis]|uniref:Amino acid ABC transporter substrate-binding protein n=1 Tax=Oceanospirillum sediminis TaxID=2760088 RepID=A0A839IPZ0_9GAMM|nr:transporter substrate-binding domain-containing protein [Oceanospirillum sediminis]MBB1486770.1 amino acid ABC transporter substrate-binding protein [Oceanospirillum sediminis]
MQKLRVLICSLLISFSFSLHATDYYRIGVTTSFQPFNYQDKEGKFTGFNIDIAKQLCSEMRAECEFVAMKFPEIIPALEKGEIDFSPSNFLYTAERARKVNFSIKYYRSTTSLIGSVKDALEDPENLLTDKAKIVAVQKDSVQHRFLIKHGSVNIQAIPSIGTGLKLLRENKVDYLIAPTLFTLHYLQKPENHNLDFIGEPIDGKELSGTVHIAISKKQPELKHEMDQAITRMVDNGHLRAIINQYFPFDVY